MRGITRYIVFLVGLQLYGAVGAERALFGHVDEQDVTSNVWSFAQLRRAGKLLFDAKFTNEDGAGRPGATGNGSPTQRPIGTEPRFLRTAGPDANSCFGCHNDPASGGAGDFVTNVFAGTPSREPAILSISPTLVAERGTPSLFGAGVIEMLAREMTRDLQGQRSSAIEKAVSEGKPVRLPLVTKGVEFGHIIGLPDGNVDRTEINGVDKDLVVRPWGQKGVVTSLRTFTNTAMNQHHGMESVERFGMNLTGTPDFGGSGVQDALTVGDITAITVYQASLPVPGRVLPKDLPLLTAVATGEKLFTQIGCAECHKPRLPLYTTTYSEPGPYNLEGNLRLTEVVKPFTFDFLNDMPSPRPEMDATGILEVHAYTDLKRHVICDRERPFFCNETLVQGFVPVDQFITKRLWEVGNGGPYGHRHDLTTIREAILAHGGEARGARLNFEDLGEEDRTTVIEFLKTLQTLPESSPPIITKADAEISSLPYRAIPESTP